MNKNKFFIFLAIIPLALFCTEEFDGYETDETFTTACEEPGRLDASKDQASLSSLAVKVQRPRISSSDEYFSTYSEIMKRMGLNKEIKTLHDSLRENKETPPLFTAINASKMIVAPSATLVATVYLLNKMGTSLKFSLPTLSFLGGLGMLSSYYFYKSADATLYQDAIQMVERIRPRELQHIAQCLKYQEEKKINPFLDPSLLEATFSVFCNHKIGRPLVMRKEQVHEALNGLKITLDKAMTYCTDKPFTVKAGKTRYPLPSLIHQEKKKLDTVEQMILEVIQ